MDFAWLYGKWKLFSLLFAKPHTHYSVTARVSELLQNQVTHQFHYFICCVKVRHKKTLEKTWPCPTCPISQTPGMFSVNFFLDARLYYVFNIHTRKGNKTSVKSFPSGILKGKLSLATHTHTHSHTPESETRAKMTVLIDCLIFVSLSTTEVMPVVFHPMSWPQKRLQAEVVFVSPSFLLEVSRRWSES